MSDAVELLVFSGPVCAGKTTLADALAPSSVRRLSTRELLLALAGDGPGDRDALQRLGDGLDDERGGEWVADAVRRLVGTGGGWVAVDAIRTLDQLDALRRVGPVVHCHLRAPREELERRQAERHTRDPGFEPASYDEILASETERRVTELAPAADVVLDTARFGPACVAAAVAALL